MKKAVKVAKRREVNSAWQAAQPEWRRHLLNGVQLVVILAVFFVYVLLRIQPHLLYHLDPGIFPVEGRFFVDCLGHPGGIVHHFSAFLSTTLSIGWLGTLELTVLALLIGLATRQLLVTVVGQSGHVLPLVPALLLLVLLGQYIHPVELCVGLVTGLWLANVYFLVGSQHEAVRLIAFAALSAVAYYFTSGLYAVFACLCGIYELSAKRNRPLGALGLLCGLMVPMAGANWFDLNFNDACGGLMISARHWLAVPSSAPVALTLRIVMLLYFPLTVAILAWRKRNASGVDTSGAPTNRTGEGKSSGLETRVWNRKWPSIRWAIPSLFFLLPLILADLTLFDSSKKNLLQMACSAEDRRWDEVLATFERLPKADTHALDFRTTFHVNRALYFAGDLPDRMFAYPQALNGPSLALVIGDTASMAQSTPRQCSEILFELGRINEAEHMSYEALEIYGDWPCILKRLVQINVLKGRPEAARRFLALLNRSLLHRQWSRDVLRRLEADPILSAVPTIADSRRLMVRSDSLSEVDDLEGMLQELLESNPQNRMAFEYLMAHYLLTRQLDKLVANLYRLDDLGYQTTPRHYEEAIVMHLQDDAAAEADLGERVVRDETWQRHAAFMITLQQFSEDEAAVAYETLHGEYGDSYFFFCVFGSNSRSTR